MQNKFHNFQTLPTLIVSLFITEYNTTCYAAEKTESNVVDFSTLESKVTAISVKQSSSEVPEHFPKYAQDQFGLWYFTFPTEIKRVHSLFSTKDNIKMVDSILDFHQYNGNVLDCGAHIGTFSVPIASKITGTVFAFEIQKPLALQLAINAFLNDLDIQVFNHALGNPTKDSEEFLNLPILDYKSEAISSHLGAFSLMEEFRNRHNLLFNKMAEKKYQKIKLEKIDDFHLNGLILIKVDVEGMDLEVIKGMNDTIIRNQFPPILFECHDMNSQYGKNIFGYLRNIGYLHFSQSQFHLDFLAQHNSKPVIKLLNVSKIIA